MQLKIEYLPVSKLKPYEKNARKHQDYDVDAIVASIGEFEFSDPIGVWGKDNIVVEGHGRLLAAKKLGMKTVPCIRLDHLNDEQRRAYALAHNKTAENSEWDLDILPEELESIVDIDMTQFGFELPDDDFEPQDEENKGSLAERFLVSPFSVINGNTQNWFDRKRAWVEFGIRSDLGRGGACVSIPPMDGKTSTNKQHAKAYADGLIKKREQIRKGLYNGKTV